MNRTDLDEDSFPLTRLKLEDVEEVLPMTMNDCMSGNTGFGTSPRSDPETETVSISVSSTVIRVRLTSAVTEISCPDTDGEMRSSNAMRLLCIQRFMGSVQKSPGPQQFRVQNGGSGGPADGIV